MPRKWDAEDDRACNRAAMTPESFPDVLGEVNVLSGFDRVVVGHVS